MKHEATVERMERDNDRADEAYERSKGESFMSAQPDNIFDLHARSERLTMDVARKQMGNDILRAMLAAKPNGAQAQVDAVIALCDAEAKK